MSHYHALVWIDHHEAKVFYFNATDADRIVVAGTHSSQHLHHKANSGDSGHAPIDKAFLKHVCQDLAQAGAILITGPGGAKKELASFIEQTQPELAIRISGVETVDHPSDGMLLALARKFFRGDDRMHPQSQH
jgi:stalled ribosome rescue protein Dom34